MSRIAERFIREYERELALKKEQAAVVSSSSTEDHEQSQAGVVPAQTSVADQKERYSSAGGRKSFVDRVSEIFSSGAGMSPMFGGAMRTPTELSEERQEKQLAKDKAQTKKLYSNAAWAVQQDYQQAPPPTEQELARKVELQTQAQQRQKEAVTAAQQDILDLLNYTGADRENKIEEAQHKLAKIESTNNSIAFLDKEGQEEYNRIERANLNNVRRDYNDAFFRQDAQNNAVLSGNRDGLKDIADYFLRQASAYINAPSRFGDTNGALNFFKGIGQAFDRNVSSIVSLKDWKPIRDISKKINIAAEQSGKEFGDVDLSTLLSDAEQAVWTSYLLYVNAIQERENDLSVAYRGGRDAVETLPFLVDMIVGSKVGNLIAKGSVKLLAKSGIKGSILRNITKWASKGEGIAFKAGELSDDVAKMAIKQSDGSLLLGSVGGGTKGNLIKAGMHAATTPIESAVLTSTMPTTYATRAQMETEQYMSGKNVDGTPIQNGELNKLSKLKNWGDSYWETLIEKVGEPIGYVASAVPGVRYVKSILDKATKVKGVDFLNNWLEEVPGEEMLGNYAVNKARELIGQILGYDYETIDKFKQEAQHAMTLDNMRGVTLSMLPTLGFGAATQAAWSWRNHRNFNDAKAQLQDILKQYGDADEKTVNNVFYHLGQSENWSALQDNLRNLSGALATKAKDDGEVAKINEAVQNFGIALHERYEEIVDFAKISASLSEEERDALYSPLMQQLQESGNDIGALFLAYEVDRASGINHIATIRNKKDDSVIYVELKDGTRGFIINGDTKIKHTEAGKELDFQDGNGTAILALLDENGRIAYRETEEGNRTLTTKQIILSADQVDKVKVSDARSMREELTNELLNQFKAQVEAIQAQRQAEEQDAAADDNAPRAVNKEVNDSPQAQTPQRQAIFTSRDGTEYTFGVADKKSEDGETLFLYDGVLYTEEDLRNSWGLRLKGIVEPAASGNAEVGKPQKARKRKSKPTEQTAENVADNSVQSEQTQGLKPIGEGVFGKIYDQFKGKAKEAFNFLLAFQNGDLLNVFYRDEIGGIDLVWGNKKAGLQHILDNHVGAGLDFEDENELFTSIENVIKNGNLIKEKWDKVVIEHNGNRVVINRVVRDNSGNIIDGSKKWIVTAYDNTISKNDKRALREQKQQELSHTTRATPDMNKEGRAVASDNPVVTAKVQQNSENPNDNPKKLFDEPVQEVKQLTKRKKKETNFQKRLHAIGEPYNLEERILLDIASGLKFKWGKKKRLWKDSKLKHLTEIERGLGDLWDYSEHERRVRIGILSNDGITPEQYAEKLWGETYSMDDTSPEIDSQEVLNMIQDVLQFVTSRSQALEILESRRQNTAIKELRHYEDNYLSEIEAEFSEELRQFSNGLLSEGHIFHLGYPLSILESVGIDYQPIELSSSRLLNLSNDEIALEDLKGLPAAINYPLAIFNGKEKDSKVILTNIEIKGKKLLIGLSVLYDAQGNIRVNTIRSLTPKESIEGIMKWINEGRLAYVDKTGRMEEYMKKGYPSQLSNTTAKATALKKPVGFTELVSSAAKVLQNFENPKINLEYVQNTQGGTPQSYGVDNDVPFSVVRRKGAKVLKDKQGNPLNADGTLKVEKVNNINEITDKDFINPTRNVQLPTISNTLAAALNTNDRPVIIKKNVFEKNREVHPEFDANASRSILNAALYSTNMYGATQPITRPDYRVAIRTSKGANAVVVLDIYQNKDNVEIVGWRKIDEKGLARMKRQATREDGQLLILSPITDNGSAAALSALPSANLSATKVQQNSENPKINLDFVQDGQGGTPQSYGVDAGSDVPFSIVRNRRLKGVNERFNAELEQQIEGTLSAGHIYQLGMPSAILRQYGFPNNPIELSASHLAEKAKAAHHPYALAEIKDLVKAIQKPIAIFTYGDKTKAQNIIIEFEHEGKNFVVGVHFNQERRGNIISDIRGLYPKDNAEWLNWIIQGKALYLDKNKIQTLVNQQRRTLAEVEYLDLNLLAKILQDFDNNKHKVDDSVRFSIENPKINLDAEYMSAEMQAIKERAIADGTFMKAPNGQPTNLTERQWLQVRTQAFKRWFGDWELMQKQVRISDASSLSFANNNAFIKYAKEHFQTNGKWNSYINKDTGNEIHLSSTGISKSISNKAVEKSAVSRANHLRALGRLDEILENSILGETHKDKNGQPSVLEMQRYYGAVIIDGDIYRVKTTVKKVRLNNKELSNRQYSFEVQEMELIEERPVQQGIGDTKSVNSPANSNNSISATKLLQNVKSSKEKGKKLLDCSKIIDENGEPLVVYHQTQNNFTQFDPMYIGAGRTDYLFPYGIFLKKTDKNIKIRGGKQMALYANLQNPLCFTDRDKLETWLKNHIENYQEILNEYNQKNNEYAEKLENISSEIDIIYEKWKNGEIDKNEYDQLIEEISQKEDNLTGEWLLMELKQTAILKELVSNYLYNSEYDGIIIDYDQGSFGRYTDTINAFSPNQIKSATDNSGDFSLENDDIRFSIQKQPTNEAEIQAIKERAIADGTFMKAPNGQPTNLTERQWLQVRTKAFKRWFCDWEIVAKLKAILNLKAIPAKTLMPNETYESAYKNIGSATNKHDGTTVRFFNTAFKKIVKEGGLSERVIPNLKEIFENSILAYTEQDNLGGTPRKDGTIHKNHDNITEYRNYVGKVLLSEGKEEYYVRFTVAMQKGDNGVHSYFVTDVNLYENITGATSFQDLLQTSVSANDIMDTKLRQFFEKANQEAKKCSKIVDENGEPLVVYHGRAEENQFTEFKAGRFGSLTGGIYFTPNLERAKYYSRRAGSAEGNENIVEAFVNIKNPLYTQGQFIKEDEKKELKKGIYDGVVFKHNDEIQELNALSPNQIKSATDNIGTFDASENDILFSRISGDTEAAVLQKILSANDASRRKYYRIAFTKNLIDIALNELGINATNLHIISDVSELPPSEIAAIRAIVLSSKTGDRVRGWYNPKTNETYLYALGINSIDEAKEVIFHELIAHKGIRGLFGEKAFDGFCNNVWQDVMSEEQRREMIAYVLQKDTLTDEEYKAALTQKNISAAADEFIAHIAEGSVRTKKSVWAKIVQFFKDWLRQMGVEITLTQDDITNAILESYKRIKEQKIELSAELNEGASNTTSRNSNNSITPAKKVQDFENLSEKTFSIKEINERFNAELQQQIDGTLPAGHIYQLGMPSEALRLAGFPNLPIELSASHLAEKSKAAHHPYELAEVKDLVNAIQDPIAIFSYGDKSKAQNVVIAFTHKDKNFIVGVHFNQKRDNIKVSSVRGLYPKDNAEWLNWITQEKALYLNKEKIQTLIRQQRRTLADVAYLDLDSIAKILQDFENPSENVRLSRLNIKEVNDRFNTELQQQIDGTLPVGHIYELGMPSAILRSTGFPNLPIELSASHLIDKRLQKNHLFDIAELVDLPEALQNPIAIFTYGDKSKAQNVIIELTHGDKNFLVGVHFNQERRGLQVSDIRGLFPKDNAEWLNWITQGKALYLDKEKIQTLISQQQINLAEVAYLDLDSVAKILQDFENPSENVRFSRLNTKEINDRFNAELQQQIDGTLPANHTYNLGIAGDILQSAGIQALPIELRASRLQDKSMQANHPFDLQNIKNLPEALQNPIMIFDSATQTGRKVILTELQSESNNFVVALGTTFKKNRIQVNDIRSIYPKDYIQGVIDWINTGDLLRYVEKNKALDWISQQQSNSAEVTNPIRNLNSAAKVLQNFENPKIIENFEATPLNTSLSDKQILFSYNPRSNVPNVKGGWTEKKILRYLKQNPTLHGLRNAIRIIAEFNSPQELKEHMFYHGSAYGSYELKPSVTMHDKEVEHYGGGGYGEKYWGISITKNKRIASNFGGISNSVKIYPIVLAKNANVIERKDFTDAYDINDHIVEFWEQGIDGVWIGDKNEGEQELCVLNPRAICVIEHIDFYNTFGLGTEGNPLKIADDKTIERIYQSAKEYKEHGKKPIFNKLRPSKTDFNIFRPISKPNNFSSAYLGEKGKEKYKSELKEYNDYITRLNEYEKALKQWEEEKRVFENSEEYKAWQELTQKTDNIIRFSIQRSATETLDKIRNSESVKSSYNGEYELNRKSAKQWAKENIKGIYTIDDTQEQISVSNVSIDKVTSHGEREEAHLKSIADIPQIIKNAIFLTEEKNEKDNGKFNTYRYYTTGLKIGDKDYTVKVVVGVKEGKRYYDHTLLEVEKNRLLDDLKRDSKTRSQQATNGFISTEDEPNPSVTVGKDTRLISILQKINDEAQSTPLNTSLDEVLFSIKVNHNSPYLLKKADGSFIDPETGERLGFDHRFMGKGEGAQAHGWGSYFSVRDLREYAENTDTKDRRYITYKGKRQDDFSPSSEESRALNVAYDYMIYSPQQEINGVLRIIKKDLARRTPGDNTVRWDIYEAAAKFIEENIDDFEVKKELYRHHYDVEIPKDDGVVYIQEYETPNRQQIEQLADYIARDEKARESFIKTLKDSTDIYGLQKEVNYLRDYLEYETRNEEFKQAVEDEDYDWYRAEHWYEVRDLAIYTMNQIIENEERKGVDLYNYILPRLLDDMYYDRERSQFLSKAGFVGIHYDGQRDGECYVIFNENDAVITDHTRFSRKKKQEYQKRVQEWLSDENINWAKGRSVNEIIKHFGNELQPIAEIHPDDMKLFPNTTDNHLYTGKGYFIDHAANHHSEVAKEEYNYIQEIVDNADDIKNVSKENGSPTFAFVKKINKGYAVVVELSEEQGKIMLHKSFFYKDNKGKRMPYASYPSVRHKNESSVVGTTTLSPISEDIAGRHRIPALDDSDDKDSTRFSKRQIKDLDNRFSRKKKLQNTTPLKVTANRITKEGNKAISKTVNEWAEKNIPTPKIYDTEIGEVVIDKRSIKDSISHGVSQAKLDAIPSLIKGFENATYLGSEKDKRGNDLQNYYFAYPIEYLDELCYVFCRTRGDNQFNRLYIHEVFSDSELKKEAHHTAASDNQKPHGGILYYRQVLSDILSDDDWLGLAAPKATSPLTEQELSIAKVVQDFENPKENQENIRLSIKNNEDQRALIDNFLVDGLLATSLELNTIGATSSALSRTLRSICNKGLESSKALFTQEDYEVLLLLARRIGRRNALQNNPNIVNITALSGVLSSDRYSAIVKEALGALMAGYTEVLDRNIKKVLDKRAWKKGISGNRVAGSVSEEAYEKLSILKDAWSGRPLQGYEALLDEKDTIEQQLFNSPESEGLARRLDELKEKELLYAYAEDTKQKRFELFAEFEQLKKAILLSRSVEEKKVLLDLQNKAQMNLLKLQGEFGKVISDIYIGGHSVMLEVNRGIQEHKEAVHKLISADLMSLPMKKGENAALQPSESKRAKKSIWGKIGGSLFAPLQTVDFMLKVLGRGAVPNGEGRIYHYYMHKLRIASDIEFEGINAVMDKINAKIKELWGKDAELDKLQALYGDSKKVVRIPVYENLRCAKEGEQQQYTYVTLTQSQACYLYMCSKMDDGLRKLYGMGIDAEVQQQIVDSLPSRLRVFADWLQSDLFVWTHSRYTETHKQLFGVNMGKIENYVPLRIDKRFVRPKQEAMDDNIGFNVSGTVTGGIIQRTVNDKPICMEWGVFDVMISHIRDMEHWNAYAPIVRDINILFNAPAFRLKTPEIRSISGFGNEFAFNLKRCFRIAVGRYVPQKDDSFMDIIGNMYSMSKIGFRVSPAVKQLLSIPAYIPEFVDKNFRKYFMQAFIPGNGAVEWCKKHIPNFNKRQAKGDLGDTRILKETDFNSKFLRDIQHFNKKYGLWLNKQVDVFACAVGAYAKYHAEYDKYIALRAKPKMSSEEKAALQAKAHAWGVTKATVLYNASQQSSEGAFVSATQQDKTLYAMGLSVFNNSQMSYTRRFFESMKTFALIIQNQKHYIGEYMQRGMTERQAEKEIRIQLIKSVLTFVTFGFILQGLWSLGGSAIKLASSSLGGGGDEEQQGDAKEKKRLLRNVYLNAALSGISGTWLGKTILSGANYRLEFGNQLPVLSDMNKIAQLFRENREYEAVKQICYIGVSCFGVSPEATIEVLYNIAAACDYDIDLTLKCLLLVSATLDEGDSVQQHIIGEGIGLKVREQDANRKKILTLDAHKDKVQIAKLQARNKELNGEINSIIQEFIKNDNLIQTQVLDKTPLRQSDYSRYEMTKRSINKILYKIPQKRDAQEIIREAKE